MVDIALPRIDPTLPKGRQGRSSSSPRKPAPRFVGCQGGIAVSGPSRVADWPPNRPPFPTPPGVLGCCAPVHPKRAGISRLPRTPRRRLGGESTTRSSDGRPRPHQRPVVSPWRRCTCAISQPDRLCLLAVKTPVPLVPFVGRVMAELHCALAGRWRKR